MNIIEIPTEQTTAFTDFILFVMAFVSVFLVKSAGIKVDKKKTLLWMWIFILLTIASFFGAIAHGFQMTENLNYLLWQPLNLSLGLMISLIVVAVIYDSRGSHLAFKVLPLLLSLGIIFYIITLVIPGKFIVFILYEAVAMLFALISYLILSLKGNQKGAVKMTLGIFISILASVIQAMDGISLHIIWIFDHNGLFHLVQMMGVILLLSGLRTAFKSV